MSYILDALRKADAQRERDPAARGIHAQPVRVAVGQPRPRPGQVDASQADAARTRHHLGQPPGIHGADHARLRVPTHRGVSGQQDHRPAVGRDLHGPQHVALG